MKSRTIIDKVREAAKSLGGEFKIASRGVPYFVLRQHKGVDYSVCYFAKTKTWKVFWPYLQFDGTQQRETFYSLLEVSDFLNGRDATGKQVTF